MILILQRPYSRLIKKKSNYITHHCWIKTIIEKRAKSWPSFAAIRRIRVTFSNVSRKHREGNFFTHMSSRRRHRMRLADGRSVSRPFRLLNSRVLRSFWADPERRTTTSRYLLTCFYHLRAQMRSGRGKPLARVSRLLVQKRWWQ